MDVLRLVAIDIFEDRVLKLGTGGDDAGEREGGEGDG